MKTFIIILAIIGLVIIVYLGLLYFMGANIGTTVKACVGLLANPTIWPCNVVFIRVRYNMEITSQVVDFSRYDDMKIIGIDVMEERPPKDEHEEEIDGELLVASPCAIVYSPTEGVYTWIAS